MTEQNGHGRDHVRDHENDEVGNSPSRRPMTDAEREERNAVVRKLMDNAPHDANRADTVQQFSNIHAARRAARAEKGQE